MAEAAHCGFASIARSPRRAPHPPDFVALQITDDAGELRQLLPPFELVVQRLECYAVASPRRWCR